MKILWFCNTPCCALKKLTGNDNMGGGWLNTLSTELSKTDSIELHISFYWSESIDSFVYDDIHYHPIYMKDSKNKIARLLKRLKITYFSLQDESNPLLNVVNKVQPDLIHIHGTEENFGIITKCNLNIPIVISIQGFLSSIYLKLFAGIPRLAALKNENFFTKISCNGAKYNEQSLKKRAQREIEILKNTKYLVGRTEFDKNCTLIANPNREYFKVGEIMRDEFFMSGWNKSSFSETFTITTTISNGLYKGLDVIYDTANLLKGSNFNFVWNIVGANETSDLVLLTEKYTKLHSKDINIRLLGRKNAKSIAEILKESDLYCQTSHIENSPNSTAEAMAIGMPIIASFVGGTSSMIENNKTGILVQDGDPYVLAGAILNMANNFDKAKELGGKARLYAIGNFTSQQVKNEILNTYNCILNK